MAVLGFNVGIISGLWFKLMRYSDESESSVAKRYALPCYLQPTFQFTNNAAACTNFTRPPPPLLLLLPCLQATSFTTCVHLRRGKRLHPPAARNNPALFSTATCRLTVISPADIFPPLLKQMDVSLTRRT